MDQLSECKKCGSHKLHKENGALICDYCGARFPFFRGSDVVIDIQSDISLLLEKCKKDPKNAKKYANLILDIDPQNTSALDVLRGKTWN